MFPHSWFNFQPEECILYLKTPFSSTWRDFTIEAGYYAGAVNLLQRCNEILHDNVEAAGQIIFTWNPATHRVGLYFGENHSLIINSCLMEKRGFTKEQHTFEGRDFKSNMAADPNCSFNDLYVYCDAADAITVGDTKAPLPHVVDGSGNFEDTITDCIRCGN